jgi:hypothetical protein
MKELGTENSLTLNIAENLQKCEAMVEESVEIQARTMRIRKLKRESREIHKCLTPKAVYAPMLRLPRIMRTGKDATADMSFRKRGKTNPKRRLSPRALVDISPYHAHKRQIRL